MRDILCLKERSVGSDAKCFPETRNRANVEIEKW